MGTAENILVVGTNWLGDTVMSMPAVQLLRARRPGSRITVLVKPQLVALWRLHPAVDETWDFEATTAGTLRAARRVGGAAFDDAFVLPNSLRSALIPFLGRVGRRCGLPGEHRAWMLSRCVRPAADVSRRHQQWEYAAVVSEGEIPGKLPAPRLALPKGDTEAAAERLGGGAWVAMLPGAARGPAKRWPGKHFAEVGRRLVDAHDCRIAVFGSSAETGLCGEVSGAIGERAVDLSGATSLRDLAALLHHCACVVSNDSGGMHLAAAVGTPVVAVFGVTDPEVTGPLGSGHTVLLGGGASRSRDVPRQSAAARECLLSIRPRQVVEAAETVLQRAATAS